MAYSDQNNNVPFRNEGNCIFELTDRAKESIRLVVESSGL